MYIKPQVDTRENDHRTRYTVHCKVLTDASNMQFYSHWHDDDDDVQFHDR